MFRSLRSPLFLKGVVLVAVPLIFWVAFATFLFKITTDAQKQAQQRAQNLADFQQAVLVAVDGYQAVFASITYSIAPTMMTYQEFVRERNVYALHAAQVQRIQSPDPLTNKSVQAVCRGAVKTLAILDEIDYKVRHAEYSLEEGFKYGGKGMLLHKKLKEQLEMLRADYVQRVEQGEQEQKQAQELLRTYLMGGTCLSVLMAFGLCYFFSQAIVQRLKVVAANTLSLAAESKVHNPVGGKDEISELDQTLRKVADIVAEARRSERAVVDNASDIICTIDANGRFASINPACLKIWGYDPTELIGRRCIDLLEQGGQPSILTKKDAALPDESGIENRVKRKDGSYGDMLWSVQKGADDRSLFCVVHDITERKEAERFKQQLTAMVSHDLRTPLTSIQGSLTLLSMGALGELPERALQKTKVVETEVVRLIAITNDLLEMESLTSGKLELFISDTQIADVLERSFNAVETFAEQHDVHIEISSTDLTIKTDADRLARVLVNLLSNAVKFSAKGSSVNVTVSEIPGWVEISVKDSGRGIPDGYHEIIFERFRQVEESDAKEKGGSGLGLAICKSIIEQLGGTIGVESKLGEGSRFWLRLPDDKS